MREAKSKNKLTFLFFFFSLVCNANALYNHRWILGSSPSPIEQQKQKKTQERWTIRLLLQTTRIRQLTLVDHHGNGNKYFCLVTIQISMMNFLILFAFGFDYFSFVYSATSSSVVFTNTVKYKNPKLEKTVNNWKTDIGNEDGSK